MKIDLETEGLKSIAKDVAETLKPLFKSTKKSGDGDIVMALHMKASKRTTNLPVGL